MTSRILPSNASCHCAVSPLPIIALALFLSLLPLSNVAGEIIEIPLPELTGSYTIDPASTRTVAFDLGQPVTEVHHGRRRALSRIRCFLRPPSRTRGISYWMEPVS